MSDEPKERPVPWYKVLWAICQAIWLYATGRGWTHD
jgi:hypothetical protein